MCTLLPFLDFLYFLFLADLCPRLPRHRGPGRHVGVMVEAGHHEVGAGAQPRPPHRPRQSRGQARHVGAEHNLLARKYFYYLGDIFDCCAGLDLVRVTVEECRHGGAGAGHASDGLEGGGVAAAQVGCGGGHLGRHCIDNILGKNLDGNIKCIFPKMFLILPDQCTFLP